MIPISTLVKAEKRIHEVFPKTKVYVAGGIDYGFLIQTEIEGHGGIYHIRREFTGQEIDRVKNKDILFKYFANEVIEQLKEKGFEAREQ